MMANGLDYFVLRYALATAGLVEVAVNTQHQGQILRRMLETADLGGLVLDGKFAQNLEASGFDKRHLDVIEAEVLHALTASPLPWNRRPRPSIRPQDAARILFTSGTTGPSKAVELSHAYEVYTAERLIPLVGVGPEDRWLFVTPMFHIDAIHITSLLLHTGGCMVVAPDFSVSRFWHDVASSQATYLCYLGSILALLMKGPDAPAGSSLRVAVGGGASAALIEKFERRFGLVVLEAFAMTECIACTTNAIDDRRIGSVGRAVDGYEVMVVDGNGHVLAPGHTGEIVVNCHEPLGVMNGYFADPEATERAMHTGALRTGDLGMFDDDGYLYYRGRLKDSIRRRGENISAMELEAIVDLHPAVQGSAAVGVPSEFEDEDVLLFVQPMVGARLDPAEICTFVEQRAARFMVPEYVFLIDELPRTQTQKVQKSLLPRISGAQAWRRRDA